MPPIWIAIDEKFAKPHSAYVAMSWLCRVELVEMLGHVDVRDELVDDDFLADEAADEIRVLPRHADEPGQRREHPAEHRLQRKLDRPARHSRKATH